jgi:hypothetical protein
VTGRLGEDLGKQQNLWNETVIYRKNYGKTTMKQDW